MNTERLFFWDKHKFSILLVLVGFLVYFNSLFSPFVWDDIPQIQQNYFVHSISNIAYFFLGSTYAPQNSGKLVGIYYRPLMTTAFSALYTLFGAQTFFYHFFQLSLHMINAMLLFSLFKKFLKEQLAFMLSLVFLVHPLNIESVVYIATLGEPLFFLFGMIALLLLRKSTLTSKKSIGMGILILCSLFSKETGVLFVIIILCYYLIFHKKSLKETGKAISLCVVPVGIYLFFRFFLAHVFVEKIPDVPMMTASLAERLMTMPAIFFFYLKTFFFPKDLIILQEWMVSSLNTNFYPPLFIDIFFLALLCGLGIWIWRTNKNTLPSFIFFFLWFLVGIGFHMQLIPLDYTVADYMFYFPMVGLLGVVGVSLQNIKRPNHTIRIAGTYFAIFIICILSVRTLIRNTNWYDGITLYSHDLQYGQNDRIENLLASEFVTAGNYPEAQKHLEALLSRNPKEPVLFANLAQIYEVEGNFQKADAIYQKELQLMIPAQFMRTMRICYC